MNLLEDENLAFKSLMVITMLVVVVTGLKLASPILSPFLLSLFLAIISASFINFFVSKGVPRSLSWISVFISVIGFLVVIGFLLSSSLYELELKFPEYMNKLDTIVDHYILASGRGSYADTLHIKASYHPGHLLKRSLSFLNDIGTVLSNSLLVILMVVFMLVQRRSFVHKVEYLSINPTSYRHFQKIIKKMDKYILILSFISMLTGITVYIVLTLMGIDFALLWALMAFMLNVIPNIGSIISAVPPILLALIQYDPLQAFFVAVAYAIINMVYGNILQPRIIGRGLDISILVVFLSMVFWGWVFGAIGMILSVPLTIMIKIILESNDKTRWIGVLLGNDPYEKQSDT